MLDTIQVVRVNKVAHDALLGTTVTFFDDNDQRWAITGDVKRLTVDVIGRVVFGSVSEWEKDSA